MMHDVQQAPVRRRLERAQLRVCERGVVDQYDLAFFQPVAFGEEIRPVCNTFTNTRKRPGGEWQDHRILAVRAFCFGQVLFLQNHQQAAARPAIRAQEKPAAATDFVQVRPGPCFARIHQHRDSAGRKQIERAGEFQKRGGSVIAFQQEAVQGTGWGFVDRDGLQPLTGQVSAFASAGHTDAVREGRKPAKKKRPVRVSIVAHLFVQRRVSAVISVSTGRT